MGGFFRRVGLRLGGQLLGKLYDALAFWCRLTWSPRDSARTYHCGVWFQGSRMLISPGDGEKDQRRAKPPVQSTKRLFQMALE